MRWILRFRICIIICLAVTLISAAVLFSVLRAVLPYATGYKNEIQLEISQQIGLPVDIDSIDAAIHWFSPRLKLIEVSVFDEKGKVPLFSFNEAFVELDIIASVMRGELIVADIGLIGADFSIEKLSENEWSVQGIKFTSEGSSGLPKQFVYMLQNSDFLLHDINVYYQDHTGGKLNLSLLNINMEVKNNFNNHKIKFSMNLPDDYGESLIVVADLQGDIDSLEGDVYVEARQLKVKQWNKKFNIEEKFKVDAVLDINLWAVLDKNNIESLIAQLNAEDVSIYNYKSKKHWQTEYLATNVRYVLDDEFWNVSVSEFYFGTKSKSLWGRPVTVQASNDEEFYYLGADFLRLKDLRQMVDVLLTSELKKDLAILDDLNVYHLQADIYNLNLRLPKDMSEENLFNGLALETTVVNFSMSDHKQGIEVLGLDAALQYGSRSMIVELQSKDLEIDLKNLMRQSIFADVLQGTITADFIDESWKLNADRLQLKNGHINTFSRFDIQLSADSAIFVDAQTDFYDAYGKYAPQYLPVGILSPGLIDWLDMAVTDGYVPHGSFILRGDLQNFPYQNKDGVFQTMFDAQDVSLKFLDGWPLLNDVTGRLKFYGQSLVLVNAKARTQGIEMFNGYVEIPDLNLPYLTVKTNTRGSNEQAQSYVWNSPLNEILGDAMRLFQLEGNNKLDLTLEIPLDEDEIEAKIDGDLTLVDSSIYYPDLGYELTDVNGVIAFTRESIFADTVTATIDEKSVSINAFTESGDFGEQVVFHLNGALDIDYLLQRYDWMPADWLNGQSDWSVDIEIPYNPEDYLVQIVANSSLEGVEAKISDKLQKPKSSKLNFVTAINVLDGNDMQVNMKFNNVVGDNSAADNVVAGNLIDLFATRNDENVWRFDIKSEYMTGKGEFTEGLDKTTKIILDLDAADVHALFVSKDNKDSKPLLPASFPALDWKVKTVLWDHWEFTDVKLATNWHKHGMLINSFSLKGPAMVFDAQGTWLTSWNGSHETVLLGNISSSNCGETLVGLGYQRSLDRCSYTAVFDSKWPAEPYGLSWANMKGKTSFEMKDGEILEVNPGTGGRLLGLLNIFKLANRLAFDFDDVTRKGFSFDSIEGDFEFVNGDGSLKNFDVSAASADINMFGSIGLVNHDYGLLMRVKPHTDTLTFAGGALLGGVAIGAGLALIQKVFDLGIIGHNVYSITGTWDQPIIEKIVERASDAEDDEDDF